MIEFTRKDSISKFGGLLNDKTCAQRGPGNQLLVANVRHQPTTRVKFISKQGHLYKRSMKRLRLFEPLGFELEPIPLVEQEFGGIGNDGGEGLLFL